MLLAGADLQPLLGAVPPDQRWQFLLSLVQEGVVLLGDALQVSLH